MYQKIKLILLAGSFVFLSACGGGGGGTTVNNDAIFGAIATQQPLSGVMFVSSKYTTQSLANSAAINGCLASTVALTNCSVRIQFVGTSQCGATARGANFIIGYASGNSISNAENNAVAICQNNGGNGCAAVQSECN